MLVQSARETDRWHAQHTDNDTKKEEDHPAVKTRTKHYKREGRTKAREEGKVTYGVASAGFEMREKGKLGKN